MLLNYNRDDNIVTLRNKNGVRLDCECLDNFEYNGTEYYILSTCDNNEFIPVKYNEDKKELVVETNETVIMDVYEIFRERNMGIYLLSWKGVSYACEMLEKIRSY